MLLPDRAMPNTGGAGPNFELDLAGNVGPRLTQSRAGEELPNLPLPHSENPGPAQDALRADEVGPGLPRSDVDA